MQNFDDISLFVNSLALSPIQPAAFVVFHAKWNKKD